MCFHKAITFNTLEKLSNNKEYIESLSVEIISKCQKNIILSCIYRLPRGDQNIKNPHWKSQAKTKNPLS